MPDEKLPPARPWVVPLIIFIFNAIFLAFFSAHGALAKLSPAMQFYFGASTFAFPIIVYVVLKKRAERGDG